MALSTAPSRVHVPLPTFRRPPLALLLCAIFAWAGAATRAAAVGSFSIVLNPGSGLSANPEALAAFQRGADAWATYISSPVTIYVDADLAPITNPNIIGSTAYASYDPEGALQDINLPFDTVRNAMAARSSRPGDEILAALPTQAQVTAEVPNGASLLTDTVGVLRANQRALGLLGNSDHRADGSITFNSNFAFDYDRSDGVNPFQIDFQTVVTHEIGHLLGFVSDVDDFDQYTIDSDNLSTLDFFRFPTAHRPTTASEFTTLARELRPGTASVLTDTAVAYDMATGSNQGDGDQASHWQDDDTLVNGSFAHGLIGIMDPSLNYGTIEDISAADLRAMELIGYNVVPEPATGLLVLLGGLACSARARRRRAA